MVEEKDEQSKEIAFGCIADLVKAARELYCGSGDSMDNADKVPMSWDKMVGYLAESIAKLKGKESDLMQEEAPADNEEE